MSSTITVAVLVFKQLFFNLIMAPKHRSGDADKSNTPGRSHKVFPLSEKVKDLHLIGGKNYTPRLLRSIIKRNFLFMKLRKGKRKSY